MSRTADEDLFDKIRKATEYHARLNKVVHRHRLTVPGRRKLQALFGLKGCCPHIPLSDVTARIEGAKQLFASTDAYFEQHVAPETPLFHFTFADDVGLTSEREPVLRLHKLRRKVDKAIRYMGLSAIVMIEVQPLTNYPQGGKGGTLMLNAHALCWGLVSKKQISASMGKLNASRSWSNQLGAKPILRRQLKHGTDDAKRIATYVSKLPYDAKYLTPIREGQYRFKPTIKGYRNQLAFRIAEGLSHYTLWDAVFGVSEGKHIRTLWKSNVRAWHSERAEACGVVKFDIPAFWRRNQISSHYRPFVIK